MDTIIKLQLGADGQVQYLLNGGSWTNIPYELQGTYIDLLTEQTGGITTTTLDWSAYKHFTKTLSANTELFDSNLPVNPEIKEIMMTITPGGNDLTLPTYWRVISGTFDNSVDNLIWAFCENDTAVAKVDTITLTGTAGNASIGAAGGLTKNISFATNGTADLTQTATNFVTDNAAAYLAQKITLTSNGADLIFTATYPGYDFTSPTITDITGDMGGSVANTAANGTGTAQVDTLTISGTDGKVTVTGAGGLSKDVVFSSDIPTSVTNFVSGNSAAYAAEGITITADTNDIVFTAAVAGDAFTSPVKNQIVGDLAGSVTNTQANVSDTAQVDTITLSGTSGGALINGPEGLVNSVVFNSSLTQTATDFVTNQAADYAAIDITVTSSGPDIIFTADNAGTSFVSPSIDNDYGDLDGSVANTTPNAVDTAQVDTVTLTGTDGEASVTVAGGLTKEVRFDSDLTTTASNFVTNWAADYLAQGIVITSSSADIIFTANVAGTGFSNPVITNVPWDLDGSVANTQANVARVAQVDTVTVTGTEGQFTIEDAGGLTKVGTFNTSLGQTCTDFVTDHAAAYATEGITLTSNDDDLIFTSDTAGTAFTNPTISAVTASLDGTVANTTGNTSPIVWCKIHKEA